MPQGVSTPNNIMTDTLL